MTSRPALVVLGFSLCLAAACGQDSSSPEGTPSPNVTTSPDTPNTPGVPTPAAPSDADPAATLLAAFDATMHAQHRMRAVTSGQQGGAPHVVVLEVQPPDRMRVTMELRPGQSIETIAIGNDLWMNPTGRFVRAPAGVPSPAAQLDATTAQIRAAIEAGRARIRFVGNETVDSMPMTVFESEGAILFDPAAATAREAGPEGTARVWIGPDGRFHRAHSERDIQGPKIGTVRNFRRKSATKIGATKIGTVRSFRSFGAQHEEPGTRSTSRPWFPFAVSDEATGGASRRRALTPPSDPATRAC